MRALAILILSLGLGGLGCESADRAEQSAKTVETRAAERPAVAPKLASVPAALTPASSTPGSCCGGGATCGGGGATCGGSCGGGGSTCGGGGAAIQWAAVPANAKWTSLSVTGMHCGGCARRVERALAQVKGVLGVEVDLPTGTVKVAAAADTDVRAIAKPAIDALGYRVQ